ncbi:MAG: dockerin type I repeat-containing protein, partial [Prevotellaceae bacterium]|nr:dockerin type I repeat-containing protein [Prevotellaceae bacterium]
TDYIDDGILTLMREHGAYTSAANRVPQPGQLCDSLFAVNLNSGMNRYFVMKWKGTNNQITVGGFTLFVRKNIEETVLNPSNMLERRGDVYIWDLLACGIPYGDRKACAQYLSFNNIDNSTDAVYIDWIRFYNNLDEIPSETINLPSGKKGDANDDGNVDVSDITTTAAYILGNNPSPFNAENADANNDGQIDVSDITFTAGIILGTH